MLLEKLILHNFGIYRGRHEIDLTPSKPSKPIVLFGALNGSGKTTLLDALQLVLYGKLAQSSNRRELAYDEYLRRSIHRGSDPRDGASIELKFRHRSGGVVHEYRVHRFWTATERTVKERLEVLRDDKPDSVLTDQWADFVEDLIPVRLSKFFFFDGEQIEALADLEKSAEVLATAIQSLLGLDLVDQLLVDLKVTERRNREKQKSVAEQAALDAARAEVERLEVRAEEVRMQRASQTNLVERLGKQLKGHEEAFRLAGGDAHSKRDQVESERKQVTKRLEEVEERLCELAAGDAPLLLVREFLDELSTSGAPSVGAGSGPVVDLLEERDRQILQVAEKSGAGQKVQKALRDFLIQDIAVRRKTNTGPRGLKLDVAVLSDLGALRASSLAEAAASISLLLREDDRLRQTLAALDRKLAGIPAAESLTTLLNQIEQAKKEQARAEGALAQLNEELRRVEADRERKWNAYARQSESDIDDHHKQEDASRIVTQSESMRAILANFKVAAAERHVRRIEALILDGLKHLLRKESLISQLHIDPATYRMTLYDLHGQPLMPERLSAGERQLLAVATIWGLARAAGRPLPVVIDTPLGRLDSVHRNHLVERYFPAASHQVLLLSTDEEIDAVQYEKLRHSVGRSYVLRFHDDLDTTVVEHGYFFQAA